jgi:hypothetical protein
MVERYGYTEAMDPFAQAWRVTLRELVALSDMLAGAKAVDSVQLQIGQLHEALARMEALVWLCCDARPIRRQLRECCRQLSVAIVRRRLVQKLGLGTPSRTTRADLRAVILKLNGTILEELHQIQQPVADRVIVQCQSKISQLFCKLRRHCSAEVHLRRSKITQRKHVRLVPRLWRLRVIVELMEPFVDDHFQMQNAAIARLSHRLDQLQSMLVVRSDLAVSDKARRKVQRSIKLLHQQTLAAMRAVDGLALSQAFDLHRALNRGG